MATSPTTATLKRLCLASGNRCAFPRCRQTLYDNSTGVTTGEVCHIRAESPGGPRYDPQQTEKERHGFDNLVMMCERHHKVIDAKAGDFPVSVLTEFKRKRETAGDNLEEPTDTILKQLKTRLRLQFDIHAQIVASVNQSGGQTAGTITNVYSQPPQRATARQAMSFFQSNLNTAEKMLSDPQRCAVEHIRFDIHSWVALCQPTLTAFEDLSDLMTTAVQSLQRANGLAERAARCIFEFEAGFRSIQIHNRMVGGINYPSKAPLIDTVDALTECLRGEAIPRLESIIESLWPFVTVSGSD